MNFSAEQILHSARADPHYLGNPDAKSLVRWIPAPDAQSELLVCSSTPSDPAEGVPVDSVSDIVLAVLKMIVQLRPGGCWVSPDGHYNPDDPNAWQRGRSDLVNLLSGQAAVTVGPVPESISRLLHDEYSIYQHAIDAILRDPLPCFTKSGFPIVEGGKAFYKLVHSWFEERDANEIAALSSYSNPETKEGDDDDEGNGAEGFDHSGINVEDLDSDREPPFRTVNVPVRPANRPTLLELAKNYSFNPLCVYMHGNRDTPLRPAEYMTALPGAIAQVTFTLSHKIIRRPKPVSYFKATIDEIEILKRPVKLSLSPSKAELFRKRGPDNSEPGPSSRRARAA